MNEVKPDRPIAVCAANEVEAWGFPFYLRPARGFEPAFLFLEDHYLNLTSEERDLLGELIRIDSEEDLRQAGSLPGEDGIYRV